MKNLKEWCLENNLEHILYYYELGNNVKKPEKIGFSSRKEVNLKCPDCGLVWEIKPNKLNKKVHLKPLCPYCRHQKVSYFYNALVIYPELVDYWDSEKNSDSLSDYFPKSHHKAYWCCKEGHKWLNSIKNQIYCIENYRKNGKYIEICPYCSKKRISATYNLEVVYPEVAIEWDYSNNGGLTPRNVSPASAKKVSWICNFNSNHIWKDRISNRTVLRRGCPECSKKFRISYTARTIYYYLCQNNILCDCEKRVGRYSIDIVIYPKSNIELPIALEIDGLYFHKSKESILRDNRKDKYLKEKGYRVIRVKEKLLKEDKIFYNNDIIIYPYKERNVFLNQITKYLIEFLSELEINPDFEKDHWKIEKFYYHERKKHSLAVLYPELSKQWSNKNKETPDIVSIGSSGDKLWICPKCHKEYSATISNRVNHHSSCPYCAHIKVSSKTSLIALYPEIAAEWDYIKNGSLTPNDVLPGTRKKVWWKCEKGHSWQTYIYNRTGPKKSKCPVCQRRLVILETSLYANNVELVNLWDYSKNILSPKQVAPYSNKKFFWKCEKGHSWEDSPNNLQKLISKKYCPVCNNRKKRFNN